MEIFLTKRQEEIGPEDVYRYHNFRHKNIDGYSRQVFLDRIESVLDRDILSIYEYVPRDAVRYMDTERFYDLVDRDNEFVDEQYRIFKWSVIHEISRIIYWGGYNASLSDEQFVHDPLERINNHVKILCEFALSRGYGIEIVE